MPALIRALRRAFRPANASTTGVLRWQYIVPRLLLVIVGLMMFDYALGLTARRRAVGTLEAALGTKAEIKHARVYLGSNQLLLGDIRIMDPDRPGQTIAEATSCQFDFASNPLLGKQWIIENGCISGLQFAPPKRESVGSTAKLRDDSSELAAAWVAQLDARLKFDLLPELPSVNAAAALSTRLASQRDARRQHVQQLVREADELEQVTQNAAANPLRHEQLAQSAAARLEALRSEFEKVHAEIAAVPDSLDDDRRAIVAARGQDEALARERLAAAPVDADALNAYLLRDDAAASLDELASWLRWMRQAVPSSRQDADPTSPDHGFFVRALNLHGTASLAGHSVEFRGMLNNLASPTGRQSKPIRLRTITTGPQPWQMEATIDRTGPEPRDELIVERRDFPLPQRTLGRPNQLKLRILPSDATYTIHLTANGDELAGEIKLVQLDAQIELSLRGDTNALPLAAKLGESKSITTRVALHGTLEHPRCTIESDLGPALAQALGCSMQQAADERSKAILAAARKHVDECLANIDRKTTEEQATIAAEMQTLGSQVERIAAGQTPRDRVSVERIGNRLPETSRFR